MTGVRIICPHCGRILGETDTNIDAVINCHSCKKRAQIKMKIVHFEDYFKSTNKEEKQ